MSALADRTPADIDTELAAYMDEAWVIDGKLESSVRELARFQELNKTNSYYDRTVNDIAARMAEYEAKLAELRTKAEPLEAEFNRRLWTRAFLVINGDRGHVHKSMSCPTCNKMGQRTHFNWLPEKSGKDETAIVEAAGDRACTSCYSSAPAWVLNKPTEIFSRDEKAAVERREERARAAAEKAAKKQALTVVHPHGVPVYGPYDHPATNVSAVTSGAVYFMQDALQDAAYEAKDPSRYKDSDSEWVAKRRAERAQRTEHLQINLEALAAYNGITLDEQTDLIREKALVKHTKGFGAFDPKVMEQLDELKEVRARNKARKATK